MDSAFLPPLQSPLKIEDFSGAKPARKRFFLWKMGFTKIAPCPRCIFALPESATPTKVFGEFRKTGEISRSNLWRLVSCSVRRQQVEPGTARSKGLRPSRALQVFNKLSAPGRTGGALHLCVYVLFTTARRMLPGPSFAARRWIRSPPQCRSSST